MSVSARVAAAAAPFQRLRAVVSAVLPGAGQGGADPPARAHPAHRTLPVRGGPELRGAAGDGALQGGPEELLQEPRRALRPV